MSNQASGSRSQIRKDAHHPLNLTNQSVQLAGVPHGHWERVAVRGAGVTDDTYDRRLPPGVLPKNPRLAAGSPRGRISSSDAPRKA